MVKESMLETYEQWERELKAELVSKKRHIKRPKRIILSDLKIVQKNKKKYDYKR
jgi:hypothetical protein